MVLGAENMAWSIMFLFLPLTCVYYPVAVLPGWLQTVAWMLPPTYVFEGLRALLIDHTFRADLMIQAFAHQHRVVQPGNSGVFCVPAEFPAGRDVAGRW